jgi:haloalkane dehalogenase
VATIKLRTDGPVAYRVAIPRMLSGAAPVVCVHGFPESSLMWEPLMMALGRAGRPCYAPDLYGFGDTADFGPATFENSRKRFGAWIDSLNLDRIVLVVHDWGGFVGLSWACDNPRRIAALVISDSGFFADGKWHGAAKALRSDQGEALMGALNREGFAGLLNTNGKTIFSEAEVNTYWEPFERGDGQRSTLEFYRSMDFEKLEPWQGKLAKIGVRTLILWGSDDPFAPLAGAKRFEREITVSKLVAFDGVGHFVFDEEPERCAKEVLGFLN